MARFERGDIVRVKDYNAGTGVVESYLEPDDGLPSVQVWHGKILIQFVGRDLDKVDLIRESSFENYYNSGNNKGGRK
ncbi:hypothetical protein UFOVP1622_23 [uncultured Caudovirales phage]|uniref:Uncharacterized protein n=1 Tax=uncultured Caudovirales phage TaxID=2100421 RepID=A0A6J5SWG4_9CAUD|nr:hypothetical protein UFOVP1021_2 [uncultured Caudovirales phage]CAB4219705.1 hypothetical protein UFOVP1622_23 [uncultured Caudovirales phage]